MLAALLVAHGVATGAVIWTFLGWRYSAFAPGLPPAWKFYLPTAQVLSDPGLLPKLIGAAFKLKLLPEAYLQGFAHVRYQAMSRGAFLLGQYSNTGWWWFFPYAFLAKSTLGELLAAGALVVAAALRWLRPLSVRARAAVLGRDAAGSRPCSPWAWFTGSFRS